MIFKNLVVETLDEQADWFMLFILMMVFPDLIYGYVSFLILVLECDYLVGDTFP